ncbi:MAG: hypothetical protein KGZ35_01655 [Truepera sp.]|nr:hypothetical protein [Truepera sp.]
MATPQRLLIVSASIGGGHVAAAKALEQAALERVLSVQHVDLLDYTTLPFRRLYQQTYFDLVRTAPDLVDWLAKRLNRLPGERRSRRQRVRAKLIQMISYRLPRLIRAYQPDVIVHTHFLPPEILSALGGKQLAPQAVIVTDFVAHSLWLQPGVGRYFVASDEVAVHLHAAGVEPERIHVSGIPIDLRYSKLLPQALARQGLGLPQDREHLLIMASGLDDKTLATLLTQLKAFRWPLFATIVCGRSPHLASLVKQQLGDYQGLIQFQVLGFTLDMPHLMASADLLVGKPGGLTSSEALAAGLPFAVVQPYPLHEEANANYLLEHGAGMRIEPLTLLNHKLKSFFEDTAKRHNMRAAALKLAKPEAAQTVVESLLKQPL